MNLNLTLVVQALHFFIAYFLIEKFFFNPLVALIQHEAEKDKQRDDTLQEIKEIIKLKEKNLQTKWYEFQQLLLPLLPVLQKKTLLTIQPLVIKKAAKPDEKTIDHIVQELIKVLEHKVQE